MSELWMAVLIWLPAATLLPFALSMLTGANWRGAIIETSLFATLALLIYPALIGLVAAFYVADPNINAILIGAFAAAALSLIVFRSAAVRDQW